ncbi:hypothetical protein ACH5RR_012459 [Cinchona calisaya]|uniref:Uncharacterized protein n=1 Tax=Cinchona calisaya TaxID=153742 RepID=A0ABD3A8C5_9GENT
MNDVLKIHLNPDLKLYEFLKTHDLAIAAMRHEHNRLDAETENTSLVPVIELKCIEKHAADVFTRKTFLMVRDNIKLQGLLNRNEYLDDGFQKIHFIEDTENDRQCRV